MSLRQQFEFISKTSILEKTYSERCENLADDFAIQFAEYIYSRPNIFNNGSSMKQVLSLFKIEKGL